MKRRWPLLGAGILALALLILSPLTYQRQQFRIRFLESRERHRLALPADWDDMADASPFWEPTYGGVRIYTYQGDFQAEARALQSELVGKGWSPTTLPGMVVMSRGQRSVQLMKGRSVIAHNSKVGTHRAIEAEGGGWLTVNYGWPSQPSPFRAWFYRVTGRQKTSWP